MNPFQFQYFPICWKPDEDEKKYNNENKMLVWNVCESLFFPARSASNCFVFVHSMKSSTPLHNRIKLKSFLLDFLNYRKIKCRIQFSDCGVTVSLLCASVSVAVVFPRFFILFLYPSFASVSMSRSNYTGDFNCKSNKSNGKIRNCVELTLLMENFPLLFIIPNKESLAFHTPEQCMRRVQGLNCV